MSDHGVYGMFQPNYTSIINTCNLWRNFDDIQDSWSSVERTIDYYGDHQDIIIANAGPGHWNDPDMVSTEKWLQYADNICIAVDHRQLWSVIRAVQDSDGHVGNIRRSSADVCGPEDHQAGLQSNPQEQENHRCQSRSSRHPGNSSLQPSPCITVQLYRGGESTSRKE